MTVRQLVSFVLDACTPPVPPPWRALLALIAVCLALQALCSSANLPTVYREWPSRRCRAVLVGRSPGDCARLPPVYHTAWVGEGWGGPR